MRTEDSTRPPRMATWLLELFSPVLQNAPLAGDLLEAFAQGRSSGWYWRQVLVAIVFGSLRALRKQWGVLAYAASCSAGITGAWWFLWFNYGHSSLLHQITGLYIKGYAMEWPWSFLYFTGFNTAFVSVSLSLMVTIALSIYLGLFRNLNPRNLIRALVPVVIMLVGSNAALVLVAALGLGLQIRPWWSLFSVVTVVALLLGMWKARSVRPTPEGLTQFSLSR